MQTSSEQTRAVFDDQPADDDMEDDVDDAVQATAGGDAMPTVMSEMVMPEHSMQVSSIYLLNHIFTNPSSGAFSTRSNT
jgi:hypothetical protein